LGKIDKKRKLSPHLGSRKKSRQERSALLSPVLSPLIIPLGKIDKKRKHSPLLGSRKKSRQVSSLLQSLKPSPYVQRAKKLERSALLSPVLSPLLIPLGKKRKHSPLLGSRKKSRQVSPLLQSQRTNYISPSSLPAKHGRVSPPKPPSPALLKATQTVEDPRTSPKPPTQLSIFEAFKSLRQTLEEEMGKNKTPFVDKIDELGKNLKALQQLHGDQEEDSHPKAEDDFTESSSDSLDEISSDAEPKTFKTEIEAENENSVKETFEIIRVGEPYVKKEQAKGVEFVDVFYLGPKDPEDENSKSVLFIHQKPKYLIQKNQDPVELDFVNEN